jgi:hypothetical protein
MLFLFKKNNMSKDAENRAFVSLLIGKDEKMVPKNKY